KPGIATVGKPWVVGGGAWPEMQFDGSVFTFKPQRDDGWLGNIGEIRIVAAALPREKWLTSRRSS
ncbi:MAG: hypothetical protein Q4G39_05680, partial [Brachymonas sp.]|nr:hypothetical protein [Brachymonas sp.]